MIKENKIKELTNDRIVPLIDQELNKYGFKYQKTKKQFVKQENGINQIVNITTYGVNYIEETDKIYITFHISTKIEIPDYENWYLEKFGQHTYFSHEFEGFTSKIELSFDDFDKDSFYEPSASQKFKHGILLSLMGGDSEQKDSITISDNLKADISSLVANLDNNSNILQIHKNRRYPYEYTYLLVFGGYNEMANVEFQEYYQYLISEIDTLIKVPEREVKGLIEALSALIKNCKIASNLLLTNPFDSTIKIIKTQNDIFEFSTKTKFVESLRFELSHFNTTSININSIGDILLFTKNQKLIKFNSKGELVFEKEIEPKKGFNKLIWSGYRDFVSGVVNSINTFYVNNIIITSENKIFELPLPVQKQKKGSLQNTNITDFVFCEDLKQYLIIYQNNFIRFSVDGQVEKILKIENTYATKIIPEKQWLITHHKDNAVVILDFEGNQIGTYEYGNGNDSVEFSNDFNKLLSFFYSTKSQLYNLINGKKDTLWAHPTFIKDYKEKMYSDINNNFGMTIAKFSPDNSFLIGGADHGKYVAWTLPKLERIELIPKMEVINLFKPHIITSYYEDKVEEKVTKAEIVTLENKKFLKNRGYDISKIFFFEGGDIFVTVLGIDSFILSWDRAFNNLTYKKIDGRINYHSQKFLTQKTEKELIIYEQQ